MEEMASEGGLQIDNTKREAAVRCLRKYNLTHILGIFPEAGSTALRYGIVWHSAMEGFYKHIQSNGWARDGGALTQAIRYAEVSWSYETEQRALWYDDYRTLENLLQALLTFINHFAGDENHLKVLDTERRFKLPIELTEEEKSVWPMPNFWFTGKIDLEIELDGRPWQCDWKTTGQALSIQANRLHRNPQQIGYTYAAKKVLEEIPEGTLLTLHQLTAYKSKAAGKEGTYGKPKFDFKRVPILFDDGDIAAWRASLIHTAWDIHNCMNTGIWPMQHDSCYTYGRCSYCDICEQNTPLVEIADGNIPEGYFFGEIWDPLKAKEVDLDD